MADNKPKVWVDKSNMARRKGLPVLIELLKPEGHSGTTAHPGSGGSIGYGPTGTSETGEVRPPLRLTDVSAEAKAGAVASGRRDVGAVVGAAGVSAGMGTGAAGAMGSTGSMGSMGSMVGSHYARATYDARGAGGTGGRGQGVFGAMRGAAARVPRWGWMAMSVAVVLFVGVWTAAYFAGQTSEAKKQEQVRAEGLPAILPPLGTPAAGFGVGNGAVGAGSNAAHGAGNGAGRAEGMSGLDGVPEVAKPAVVDAMVADAALISGLNYLVCGNFKRAEDAAMATEYLKAHGLAAATVPAREFSGRADARDQMVIIMKGYTRDKYLASGLKDKVQSLGRRWRAENRRAPTDFSQPYWDKYK